MMELLQTLRKIRACEGEAAAQLLLEAYVAQERAAERERWAKEVDALKKACADYKSDYMRLLREKQQRMLKA